MKRYVFGIVLVSMLVPVAAFCRDFGREDAEHEMALRDGEMDFQHRQAEMDMEREMQKLELEERRFKLERAREGHKEKVHPLLLLVVVIHILVAVWVHMDIRQLNRGSGIWVVIALLAGLFGALVYAVVRLGDGRPAKS